MFLPSLMYLGVQLSKGFNYRQTEEYLKDAKNIQDVEDKLLELQEKRPNLFPHN